MSEKQTPLATTDRGLRAWLQLFRLPNLLTVPGDPLVGYLLAAHVLDLFPVKLGLVLIASLCFYMAGLLVNDLADLGEDRLERPFRPLPSGAVSARLVRIAAVKLVAVGLLCSILSGVTAAVMGTLLVVAMLLYNLKLKGRPVLGPVAMGSCRGLNVLLGAGAGAHAAADWFLPAVAAVALGLYVASVTRVARVETASSRVGTMRWGPPVFALLGLGVMTALLEPVGAHAWIGMVGSGSLLVVSAVVGGVRLGAARVQIPAVVGMWIGGLLLWQAALCLGGGASIAGTILLLMWPAFRLIGRWFYAS